MNRTFKKLLSLTLCLMMVLTCGAVGLTTVYAEITMAGDGSTENPYQITTYAQLQEFSSIVNGGDTDACAMLMNDITVASDSTEFTPISTYGGTFDGQNHKIDGISIIPPSDNGCALFMAISSEGVLENLILSNVTIPSRGSAFVYANQGTVKNCILTGNITFGSLSNSSGIFASIVSQNDFYGNIINCINQCDINAGSGELYLFGIATENFGTISGCCNFGDLSGSSAFGICGINKNTVSQCANFGDITATRNAAGLVDLTDNATVSECYNAGKITGGEVAFASIASNDSGILSNIYYNSETSGCTDSYAIGKTTAELKGASVLTTLGFSEDKWTAQANDYPMPTGAYLLLKTVNSINTPKLRINEESNMWEVSYDNGTTWEPLGVKATGADGVGIASIEKTNTDGNKDTYTITLTNNNTYTFTVTNGTDGKDGTNGTDGKDGTNGTDGKDGADGVGIESVTINESGELIIKLTNGKESNLGKIAGIDGKDGTNGTDGKDGQDGAQGEKGDKGDKGDTGAQGEAGKKFYPLPFA